uniref:Adhesin n=1 Tax=Syphacia muris TaxID=451379 RepID=A0A0N5AFP7_9BILA
MGDLTDVDLRDQLNVNSANAESVQAVTDVFQQGVTTSTYVTPADGLTSTSTEFVGLGAENVHIGADDTEQQAVATMDVYSLGHHINAQ